MDKLLKDLPQFSTSPTHAGGEMANMRVRTLIDASRRTSENVEVIRTADDLPPASGGERQLEDGTAYFFDGFISDPASLRLGLPTFLYARHGLLGGYIHTGGNAAIVGTNKHLAAESMLLSAPGGTIYDLTATQDEEMLVQFVTHADPLALGSIAKLGTIDGYRVPTWKTCNFEDFDDGFEFFGSPKKIFFDSCPFRNVTAGGATIITLDGTLDTEIAKINGNCFIKDVQPDTQVVNAKAGSLPSLYFKYVGVDHDATVTKSNILNGDVGQQKVGTLVRNSFPLADSKTLAELTLDAPATVVGSGSAATEITEPTTLQNAARFSSPSNGVAQYDARFDEVVDIAVRAAVSGANTTFEVSLGLNGSILSRSTFPGFTANSSEPVTVATDAKVELTAGDQLSVFLENVNGSADLDIESLSLTV